MGGYEYARTRIPETEADRDTLMVMCETITDRLCLRLGVSELPEGFERIAADATVKMFRRMYYEGIETESVQGVTQMTTSFVDDILAEYATEIAEFKATRAGMVVFL